METPYISIIIVGALFIGGIISLIKKEGWLVFLGSVIMIGLSFFFFLKVVPLLGKCYIYFIETVLDWVVPLGLSSRMLVAGLIAFPPLYLAGFLFSLRDRKKPVNGILGILSEIYPAVVVTLALFAYGYINYMLDYFSEDRLYLAKYIGFPDSNLGKLIMLGIWFIAEKLLFFIFPFFCMAMWNVSMLFFPLLPDLYFNLRGGRRFKKMITNRHVEYRKYKDSQQVP
jgi:hypothetical protein